MAEETGFGFTLVRILKGLRREFEAGAAALEITPAQFNVLHRLWRGDGILTTELAKDTCSDAATITGVVDRLEAKEMIRRERSQQDRRAVRIYLTGQGRAAESPLMAVVAAVNQQALEGLAAEERERLLELLGRVIHNLSA